METLISLPSLAVLQCFEAAARHQSFTAAAQDLGLTQGAVSRHMKELEAHIGAPLFRRDGRGVRLTDAGHTLWMEVTSDLQRLRRTISRAVAGGEAPQVLSIAVLPTFGARWLMPRIRKFKERRQDLKLIFHSRSEPFDFIESGIDLAIHFGHDDWPGAQLTPLCKEELVLVGAPELLKEFSPQKPEDVFDLPLLHLSSRPTLWETFRQTTQASEGAARKGSYFDQFSLIIAAAVAGLGVAILPTYLIEDELRTESLIQIHAIPDIFGRSYFIATPIGSSNPVAREFSTWIRKNVRSASKS